MNIGPHDRPILPSKWVRNKVVKKTIPWLGKLAYCMLFGGFLMTDILWLRCFLTGGYVALTMFHLFQLRPLHIPLIGSFFFVCVNAGMGMWVFHERYMLLDEEEAVLYNSFFKGTMSIQAFKRIVATGEIVHAGGPLELLHEGEIILVTEPEELIRPGDAVDLVLVLEGEAELQLPDGSLALVGPGSLLGEVSFLSSGRSSSFARCVPGAKYLVWKREPLKNLEKAEPDVAKSLELFIGADLMRKLRGGKWTLAQRSDKFCPE